MATIRKRRTTRGVRWQAMVRLSGCPPTSAVFETKQEAAEWARDEESRLQRLRREGRPTGGHTLDDAIDAYILGPLKAKAPGTRRNDLARLLWWRERLGAYYLGSITAPMIAAASAELKVAPATVNRYLTALSAVFTKARREWHWIKANPVSDVTHPTEPPGRDRYFTAEEIQALIAACTKRSHELRVLVLLALTTGLRKGDLLALRRADVDLQRRVITLRQSKTKTLRGVPIASAIMPDLLALPHRLDSPLLFRIRTVDPWNTFRKDWEAALEEAKIEGASFHTCRHSVGSHAAMSGATERELMELLGHKTPIMARRYSHLSPEHLRGVVERQTERILRPPEPRKRRDGGGE